MKIVPLSTSVMSHYQEIGLKFTRFYSPEDSEVFARVSRIAASSLNRAIILDVGTGSGIPLLHAIGRKSYGIGIDIDRESVSVAAQNASRLNRHNVCFACVDMEDVAGDFDLVISNPPYIPCNGHVTDEALEVSGDGTRFVEQIFEQFGEDCCNLVLHFASISNPLRMIEISLEHGFRLARLHLSAVGFGRYTSDPSRLNYLLECKRRGESIFHATMSHEKTMYNQLLMTGHFVKAERNQKDGLLRVVNSILMEFQSGGLPGLRRHRLRDPRITVGAYKDLYHGSVT